MEFEIRMESGELHAYFEGFITVLHRLCKTFRRHCEGASARKGGTLVPSYRIGGVA